MPEVYRITAGSSSAGSARGAADAQANGQRRRIRGSREAIGEGGVEHDRPGAALIEDESELGALLPDVDRDSDRAEPQAGEEGVDELALIAQEEHDPVAPRKTETVKVSGEALRDTVELRVVEPLRAVHQRLAAAVAGDRVGEHRVEVRRPLREAAQRAAEVNLVAERRDVGPVHDFRIVLRLGA